MLRIAMAQVNATVGDLDGNAELIVAWTRRAAERGARVVVFPEMMLTGYPVEDLALRGSLRRPSRRCTRWRRGCRPTAWAGSPWSRGTWTGGPTWRRGPGCRPAP